MADDPRCQGQGQRGAKGVRPVAALTDRASSLHNRYRATMTALGIMGVTTPAERLTRGGVEGSIYTPGATSSRSPPFFFDLAATAFRADQPLPPFGNGHFSAVAFGL